MYFLHVAPIEDITEESTENQSNPIPICGAGAGNKGSAQTATAAITIAEPVTNPSTQRPSTSKKKEEMPALSDTYPYTMVTYTQQHPPPPPGGTPVQLVMLKKKVRRKKSSVRPDPTAVSHGTGKAANANNSAKLDVDQTISNNENQFLEEDGKNETMLTQSGATILQENVTYMLSETMLCRRQTIQRPFIFNDAFDSARSVLRMDAESDAILALESIILRNTGLNTPVFTAANNIEDLEELLLHPDTDVDQITEDVITGRFFDSDINSNTDLSLVGLAEMEHGRGKDSSRALSQLWSLLQRNNSASSNPILTRSMVAEMVNKLKLDAAIKQRKVVLMLLLVFVIIVCCWCPIAIIHVIDVYNQYPSIYYVAFTVLAWSNSCVNIIIYACMNPRFAGAYKALLHCKRVAHGHGITAESVDFTGTMPSQHKRSKRSSTGMHTRPSAQTPTRLISIAERE